MKTSKGVIQGYNGVAAVDNKHQVIMHAEAYGSGSEQPTLIPMVEAIRQREPRFDQAGRYKKQHRKERQELAKKQGRQTAPGKFWPKDFHFDSKTMS